MPSIAESTGVDTSGYTRVLPGQPPAASTPESSLIPRRSPVLRASAIFLPGTFPSSDSLIGYHIGDIIPQYRSPLPPQATSQGSGTTTAVASISSSSSSSTTNNPAVSQNVSTTTPALGPGSQFTGVLTMAKAFVVLQISVNAAARVRLYATQSAQSADLTRPSTQGPGFGTEQGIIGDVNLDTAPVVWQPDPLMIGANGDSPQSGAVYLTVDNIGNSSESPTVSITYVPIQS